MNRDWRCSMLLVVMVCSLAVILSGCARYKETAVREAPLPDPKSVTDTVERPDPDPRVVAETIDAAERHLLQREEVLAEARTFGTRNIHFRFDRYDLESEARAILDELGAWLLKHRNVALLIEGHCDERGTAEYNLALGERRATAARDYLVALGVAANRIETISYGEERPLDPRNTEGAWAKNRRCQFVLNLR